MTTIRRTPLDALSDHLWRLGLSGLMAFSPPALFERLYRLDWYGGMLESWLRDLNLQHGARVLEVGCGPGMLCRHLVGQGYRVTGADASCRMLRRAQRLAPAAEFQLCRLPRLPFGDGTFDAVVAASVINLVDDRRAALAEMLRVVRAGGTLSVLFPLPGFSDAASRTAIARKGGLSGAALRLWADRAPKLDVADCASDFPTLPNGLPELNFHLSGSVATLTIRR